MIKLSFIYITYRPGGYDILADSLVNQTYKDYEVIIVDDFQPEGCEAVRKYLQGKGMRLNMPVPQNRNVSPNSPRHFQCGQYGIHHRLRRHLHPVYRLPVVSSGLL